MIETKPFNMKLCTEIKSKIVYCFYNRMNGNLALSNALLYFNKFNKTICNPFKCMTKRDLQKNR